MGADSTNTADLLFAVDNLRFDTGEFDAGLDQPQGLDLDRTCSCPEPPSCIAAKDGGVLACDGPNGRDNVVGPLLANITAIAPALNPTFIYDRIHSGIFSILVSIQKWNGTPDDPDMLVSFRMALHIDAEGSDGGRPTPKFDGTDVWAVDPGSIVGGESGIDQDCHDVPCLGVGTDFTAYMRDGVLVANFASVPLVMNTAAGRVTLPFTDATLTARISGVDGQRRIAGELAGRFPTSQVLLIAVVLTDPTTHKPICASPVAYSIFKKSVCEAADLAMDPANDHKQQPCDALSAALNFTGVPAEMGHIRKANPDPSECPGFADTCR
jgi:hypothetical protein